MQRVSDFFGSNKGGAASGSSWVLKEKLEFNNEVVDGTSIPIHGNRIDRMMIITELHDAASDTSIYLRLNDDSGNNYIYLYHYSGDSHIGGKTIHNYIYLCQCDSGGTGLGRHYLYPKVTGTRRICEDQRQYIRTNNDDKVVNESYFWSNTTDEITSLDFNSDSISVTGKIYIYEWKDLNVTELHSYELIKEITMDNEVLDESVAINGDQEDEIRIVGELYDVASNVGMYMLLNNDTGNNYIKHNIYGGGSYGGATSTENKIYIIFEAQSGSPSYSNFTLFPRSRQRRCCLGIRGEDRGRVYNEAQFWTNITDEITSLDFNSDSVAVTGKIRIYRLAKSHVINRQPLSMDAFLHIQDQKAQGTSGGDFISGAWRTRDLNTVLTNTITGASLSSNQITLPAGKYYVEASAPARIVGYHQVKIRRVTATASDVLIGETSQQYRATNGSVTLIRSNVCGVFQCDGFASFELQNQCSETCDNAGFGAPANITTEVYSDIRIWRIGDYVAP